MRPASFALLLALVGCAESKNEASPPATDTVTPAGGSPALMAQEGPPQLPNACQIGPRADRNSDWSKFVSPLDDDLPNGQKRDLGVGVAILRSESNRDVFKGDFGTDSMVVRRDPDAAAPVVARLVLRVIMDRGVRNICRGFTYAADSSLYNRAYLFETGLRSLAALPVDSVTADSSWLRVIYAVDSSLALHRGWLDAKGSAEYTSWPVLFSAATDTAMIFFRDSTARFNPGPWLHSSPNGPLASGKFPAGTAAWSMYLHRVEGQWGEVHLEVGDVCGESEIRRTPGRFWVRLVDDRGRPLVRLDVGEDC